VVSWQALFAPAGTPKPIVDKLHAEILKIIQSPEMQERIKGLGMQPSVLTPEQVQAFQKAEIEKWAQVIKAAKIKLD
jgi:tripartite-type tricarboxylate transporter receptor subunit TctC